MIRQDDEGQTSGLPNILQDSPSACCTLDIPTAMWELGFPMLGGINSVNKINVVGAHIRG